MRWDDLFGDLEGQLDAAEAASVDAEVADRTRRESALLTLADRLGGSLGVRVGVHVAGAGRVDGRLLEVSEEWLLLTDDPGDPGGPGGAGGAGELMPGAQVLVPMSAVQSVAGLAPVAHPAPVTAGQRVRLGLGVALRAVARDRSPVVVHLTGGGSVQGTLERVGADFVEVTEHPAGEVRPRRAGSVRTVPFAALSLVRSRA